MSKLLSQELCQRSTAKSNILLSLLRLKTQSPYETDYIGIISRSALLAKRYPRFVRRAFRHVPSSKFSKFRRTDGKAPASLRSRNVDDCWGFALPAIRCGDTRSPVASRISSGLDFHQTVFADLLETTRRYIRTDDDIVVWCYYVRYLAPAECDEITLPMFVDNEFNGILPLEHRRQWIQRGDGLIGRLSEMFPTAGRKIFCFVRHAPVVVPCHNNLAGMRQRMEPVHGRGKFGRQTH